MGEARYASKSTTIFGSTNSLGDSHSILPEQMNSGFKSCRNKESRDASKSTTSSILVDSHPILPAPMNNGFNSCRSKESCGHSLPMSGCISKDSFGDCHPMAGKSEITSCIKFVHNSVFEQLSAPFCRCQDLPDEAFGVPATASDLVVACSHGWRHQAHPDATGWKLSTINELLEDAGICDNGENQLLHFFDFLSITQRPFKCGHGQRTDLEQSEFRAALKVMHNVYFFADRIVHLAPWEEETICGEGDEYYVSAGSLKGVTFDQVGDCIQVALPHDYKKDEPIPFCSIDEPLAFRDSIGLFDDVHAVGENPVSSVKHLEELLALCPDGMFVTMRRFPFGRVNTIPADSRGWVFLERFITMVKCAMLDREAAEDVVLTNSDAIYQQIQNGADCLRAAAEDKDTTKLVQLLAQFSDELATKKFSASSSDKLKIDAESKLGTDAKIVASIMEEFAEHLALHWQSDAAKQQKRAKRVGALVSAAKDLVLVWDRFSKDYEAKLVASMSWNILPLVKLLAIPLFLGIGIVLWPLGQPGKFKDNLSFWPLYAPVTFIIFFAFPQWLYVLVLGCLYKPTFRDHVLSILWPLGTTVWLISVIYVSCHALDLLPLPMMLYIATGISSASLPFLWFLIPWSNRRDRPTMWRVFFAIINLSILFVVFGLVYPALYILAKEADGVLQALWVFLIFCSRFVAEGLQTCSIKYLGSDCMPFTIFCGVCAYEMVMSMCLARSFHFLVVVEIIVFDLLENVYYFVCLWTSKGDRENEVGLRTQKSSLNSGTRRRASYVITKSGRIRISAVLMIREATQVLVPLWFIAIQTAAYFIQSWTNGRHAFNTIVSDMSASDFQTSTLSLVTSICAEGAVFAATCWMLHSTGDRAIPLVVALVKTNFKVYASTMTTVLLFFLLLQHSHFGIDTKLKFAWLGEHDNKWVEGFTWET